MTVEPRPGASGPAIAHPQQAGAGPSKWRHYWQMLKASQVAMDGLALVIAALAARQISGPALPFAETALLVLSGVVFMACLLVGGGYSPRAMALPARQMGAGAWAFGCLIIVWWVSGMAAAYRPPMLAAFAVILVICVVVSRMVMAVIIGRLTHAGYLKRHLVLVGCGPGAERIVDHLAQCQESDLELLGIFDDRRSRVPAALGSVPILGDSDDLIEMVRSKRVDCVIVTLPWVAEERTIHLLRKLRNVPVRIDIVTHSALWGLGGNGFDNSAGLPTITVLNRWVDHQTGLVKRAEDLVLALAMLSVLWLPMLVIAALIRLDSPGPALFRQPRYGCNNRVFDVYKFRSMRNDLKPDPEIRQARVNDPRVTRIGAFLRRSSLDELPQLLNVVRGEMSIVGPRPHAVPHNLRYGSVIDEYFARHNVKPGITGWAQVNGLRGETYTDEDMRKRVASDIHYIENWSVLFDLKIIALTALRVWFQKTAY